jgi:hypothetical protein
VGSDPLRVTSYLRQRGGWQLRAANRFRIFHPSDRALNIVNFVAIDAKIKEGLKIGGKRILGNDKGIIEDKPNGFAAQ